MTNYQTDPNRNLPPRTEHPPYRRETSNTGLYAAMAAIVALALIAWFAMSQTETPAPADVDVTNDVPVAPPVTDPVTPPVADPATPPAADPVTPPATETAPVDDGATTPTPPAGDAAPADTGTTTPVTPPPAD